MINLEFGLIGHTHSYLVGQRKIYHKLFIQHKIKDSFMGWQKTTNHYIALTGAEYKTTVNAFQMAEDDSG